MATNLTSVSLTAPLATVNIGLTESFNMEITGGYSGGGGVTSHDFTWEFDQGTSTWITIPASGGTLGLYTANTNPLVGKVTTDPESITVVGDKVGSYQIRGKGVRGANTYYTGEITVNVSTLTTVAPTTAAPTTVAPTTIAPTTLPPTTVAPTTLPPTTPAPTTIAPTTSAPTTVAPTTLPPTTVAPTTLAPTTIVPTTVAPTTTAPTTPSPTTIAPTTVAPTTVTPTTIAPTTLSPTTIAPTTLQPTTIGPTTIPGWLDGWDNRLKLTIDHTKIDAELTHFPVTVFLSPTVGSCVFDELQADGNKKKIAFTKSDGFTQLYGEIEKWDDANEKAVIHVSRDGWAISNSADTDFYLYYDIDHADNTTYIGDIDSTPGAAVWDGSFTLVCHMVDATTSTLKDSTSNNNDLTKKDANQPILVDNSKIGKAQDFDGGDDYINVTAHSSLSPGTGSFTAEVVMKTDKQTLMILLDNREGGSGEGWFLLIGSVAHKLRFQIEDHGSAWSRIDGGTTVDDDTYRYLTAIRDVPNDVLRLFVNTVSDAVAVTDTTTQTISSTTDFKIGISAVGGTYPFEKFMDEVRLSQARRTDAWIKATYNSLWDTLLTYEFCTTAPPSTAAPTTTAPTTVGPTTVAPTTLAPTTSAPTTPQPTTLPPTTVPPTTLVPTTVAPTTPVPTTIAPTTAEPTTLPPTTVAPTTIVPTTVAPTTIAPTTIAPTTTAPTTVAPTTIAPTTLAPTTLPPTTVSPTTIAPTTVAPTTIAPTTLAPTTTAPTTLGPTTLKPTTISPTTLVPTTSPPTTTGPTTIGPTTLAPTTIPPTTLAPTTISPTTIAPTTESPTTPVPTTPVPTTVGPTTIGPTTPIPTTLPPTTLGPTTPPPELFECIREINSLIAELIIILSLINNQIDLISTISEEVNLRGDICW